MTKTKMTKKERNRIWEEQCIKWDMPELAASIKHIFECPKHDLYHLTKEALAYHKHIIH
jgi:hypothetical protein